jgi:hypothetical protein
MNGHFVGSLDSSVDPNNKSEPEKTSNRYADSNDDIPVSSTARTRAVDTRLWVRNGIGCGQREGGVDLPSKLTLDTRLSVKGRVGRLDIGIQGLKLIRWDIGEPLSQEIVLVTGPCSRLVNGQTVSLDLGY